MKKSRMLLTIMVLMLLLPTLQANAHSGRTDSSGGHNCSDASKKKGLCTGYHYHNGGSAGSSSSSSSSSTSKPAATVQPSLLAPAPKSQSNELKITIPAYSIHVNGQWIDNSSSKYPVFVYKDITYFPMTWNYTQALGLNISWNADMGLFISRDITIPYHDQVELDRGGHYVPGTQLNASYPIFNIFINGTWLNNGAETYPLLTFNDITYSPMTWKFAVEELGLSIKLDEKDGFFINRPKASEH